MVFIQKDFNEIILKYYVVTLNILIEQPNFMNFDSFVKYFAFQIDDILSEFILNNYFTNIHTDI